MVIFPLIVDFPYIFLYYFQTCHHIFAVIAYARVAWASNIILAKPRLEKRFSLLENLGIAWVCPKIDYFQMLMMIFIDNSSTTMIISVNIHYHILLSLLMMMMMIDRHFSIHIFPSNGHERMGVSGTNAYFLFGNVESSTLNFGQLSLLQNSGRTPSAWMASVASSTAPT